MSKSEILNALFFYMVLQDHYFMASNTEFCAYLRLYFQYWEKTNSDEVVGYCRKNLLKPVKLRKEDVVQCIKGKLKHKSQIGNNQFR